jgi:hypothetical protein
MYDTALLNMYEPFLWRCLKVNKKIYLYCDDKYVHTVPMEISQDKAKKSQFYETVVLLVCNVGSDVLMTDCLNAYCVDDFSSFPFHV